ncbi:MAG: hypothetical protein KAI24_26475, partial [Planctomycetes bacterium]|nr:hypothetical protein [Planctomycetota bacterium]
MDEQPFAAHERSRSRAYLARISSLALRAAPTRALLLTLATTAALQAQDRPLDRTLVRSDRGPVAQEPERAGPQLLRLRYATFDPLLANPVEPALAAATNLYIVQFVGLPTEDWRAALQATGATIHSYLPDHAYVVRMPQAVAQQAARLPFVRWLGSYAPAFRLEPQLAAALALGQPLKKQRYNVVVCDKHTDKPALQARIQAIGGTVDDLLEGSILVEATLDGAQLRKVAAFDEVLWIDVWTEPELDMDNARIQGGGNYVEAQGGFTGVGVNAHIYEGIEATHPDFTGGATNVRSSGAAQTHGHATGGIVFGNGTSNPAVRGMAPDAGKFYTNY